MRRRGWLRGRAGGQDSVTEPWFRAVFEQTAIGIAVIDREGVAVSCNGALARLLARRPVDIVGHRFAEFTDPRDVARCEAIMGRVLGGEVDRCQVTKRYVRLDGTVVWGRLTATALRDRHGRIDHVIGVVEDITGRLRAEGELAHQTHHDPLTGLPNRLRLEAVLDEALCRSRIPTSDAAGARRASGAVGVIAVDVDDFDRVNDALGHVAGDTLLCQVSCRVAGVVAETDVVARLPGDELVVVRQCLASATELEQLAERIRARLLEPYALPGGRRVHLSATFGLATGDAEGATAESLLRDAEIAVHEGKARAPGAIQWFDDALRRRVLSHAEMLADLHEALDRDELHLAYQPVVRLSDGAVVAAEALLRWEHPLLGAVPPRDFLSAIEGTALLSRVTWWVLETAARQAAEWRRRSGFPVAVSVNMPAQVLLEADLVATLEHVLATAGIPASALIVELTEHALVDDGPTGRLTLDRLRELGVHLYIDDFGTGWSSLSYIKRLPVHGLKIDQCFVHGLPDDPGDASIVSAITAMARGVGLGVVAEGVETPEQLAEVRRLGVAYAQGFLLGRPGPAGALDDVWGEPVAGEVSSYAATR